MNVLTITGENKYATISREFLSDGYNYYIYVFIKGFGGNYYLNENDNVKQTESIFSMRVANEKATELLNNC